ncbi:MAG: hypothetical protein NTY66_03920 [Candidatus Vogelbacteria bacterium]|nr:hypothetical protein [Candidatus Vogelbacteria bacterium]
MILAITALSLALIFGPLCYAWIGCQVEKRLGRHYPQSWTAFIILCWPIMLLIAPLWNRRVKRKLVRLLDI